MEQYSQYLNELVKCKIFNNISENNILNILPCLDPKIKTYEKNEYIFHQGDKINKVGIIIKGSLLIEGLDYWGNSSILKNLNTYDMFGEIYAFENRSLVVSIKANTKCKIIFLNLDKMLHPCSISCSFHTILIINLLEIFAKKAIIMNNKIEILSKRTTEDKLLTYLNSFSIQKKSKSFVIPFNRQELADFLVVNRSALSKELMKLKKAGVLDFNKNNFTLLN